MKPHISIITLGVQDVEKSTQFYERLGFPVERNGAITFISASENMKLSLFGLEDLAKEAGVSVETGAFSGVTLAHNVISKAQVDMVMAEVAQAGAEITAKPQERDWGGYSGYFKDTDGYLWEVAYNPYSPEIAVDEASK